MVLQWMPEAVHGDSSRLFGVLPENSWSQQVGSEVEVSITSREVRIVVGIFVHHFAPTLPHVEVLCAIAAPVSPAHRLVVEELGIRRIDYKVSLLAHPQAQIHVVELYLKVLF